MKKTAAIDVLFLPPANKVIITEGPIRIKVYDHTFRKDNGVFYDECQDEDKGYNPTNTYTNTWISIYVENDKEQYRLVRIRYACFVEGFGIGFNKYDENLGEITNLEPTGGYQRWNTSTPFTVKFPKGSYELTIRFLGYDYWSQSNNQGNINYIELL